MDVAPNDTVSDMMKRSPSGGDMYVTSSDELRNCGVYDGSTVQVLSRVRGGKNKVKTSKVEKKRDSREARTVAWTGS